MNVYPFWCVIAPHFNYLEVPMEILARDSVQFGNGDICTATHVVGDCLFECRGHKWSFKNPLSAEVIFADIYREDEGLFEECMDIMHGFVSDQYFEYIRHNGL